MTAAKNSLLHCRLEGHCSLTIALRLLAAIVLGRILKLFARGEAVLPGGEGMCWIQRKIVEIFSKISELDQAHDYVGLDPLKPRFKNSVMFLCCPKEIRAWMPANKRRNIVCNY